MDDLAVAFGDAPPVVDGVSLRIAAGEALGLVGPSGCGKSLTALALLDLLPPDARRVRGTVRFAGRSLRSRADFRAVRGDGLATVFQDPAQALNPVLRVGTQVAEVLRRRGLDRRQARQQGLELLDTVALTDPEARWRSYPHELSGGQRQRVMIAIALAAAPQVLLADEPTTALDVTVQAQILDLLDRLRRDLDLGLLLITHDLAVVAETCRRVLVMDAGRIVEEGPVREVFTGPRHDRTRELLRAAESGP